MAKRKSRYSKTGVKRQRPRDPGTRAHVKSYVHPNFANDIRTIIENIFESKKQITIAYKDLVDYFKETYHFKITSIYIGKHIKLNYHGGTLFTTRQIKVDDAWLTFLTNIVNNEQRTDRNYILEHRIYPKDILQRTSDDKSN